MFHFKNKLCQAMEEIMEQSEMNQHQLHQT